MSLTLAIVGRPNVGKSTLFNRLVGKAMAIVDDISGVTRDWRECDASLYDLEFTLIDTAGLENARPKGSMSARTAERTHLALIKADLIVMVVDGRSGILPDDKSIAREVRKVGCPVIVLVNKCDGNKLPPDFDDASMLGFGEPIALSAVHGDGLPELYRSILEALPEKAAAAIKPPAAKSKRASRAKKIEEPAANVSLDDLAIEEGEEFFQDIDPEERKNLNLAIVGRPNAGKSTLVNNLLEEERMLTGPEPGLTRDAIPINWTYAGNPIRLIDTAGLRRRSRIDERLERMSSKESLRAIRLAHVVVLVIDATMPFDKQDYTIAQHVVEEGRGLVIAINKWDLVQQKTETMRMIQAKIEASLAQVSGVPIVTLSALKGTGVEVLMKEVMALYDLWNKRISTGQLNRWLGAMVEDHPPPIVANRRIKLRYMTQVKSRPPTFAIWVNKPVDLPESYVRFLTNGLRRHFKLAGVPIRWSMRKSKNPYEEKAKKR